MKWIMVQSAWTAINTLNPTIAEALDNADTILVGTKAGDWKNTTSCKSYAAVQAQGNLDVVMYDLEHWDDSPLEEREDPFGFYRKASQCLHSRQQLMLATPANDLILDWDGYRGANGTIYQQFLDQFFPGVIATYSDLYVSQSQALQPDLLRFTDYVSASTEQVRSNNPYCILYAGLTTRANPAPPPASQIIDAYNAVSSMVDGLWLNIPSGTSAAPMVAFLQEILS